ncbi:hypothetical protein [Pseudomonas sp.]|uniref:hypothetical protein n=1 Tax=Pseudomonas sp. TaxID=306 RepID=UPI0028AE08DE|nr:hypothetical protein [Pseudomonas sp.]
MAWQSLLEHPRLRTSFVALDPWRKVLVLVAYLHRQLRLVQAFDHLYAQRLTQVFVRGLACALADDREAQRRMRADVMQCIPDTDDYPAQEGAWAQNLLIALIYVLDFRVEGDAQALARSLRSSLDNIDLIHYEADERYDESYVLDEEVRLLLELTQAARSIEREACTDMRWVAQLTHRCRV